MPPLISSCFYPLWGEKIYGVRGKVIDILAVFATAFGVATSLGLGALQIQSGMAYVTAIPDTMTVTFVIIAVVTVMYMFSSIKGLDKGIQLLSRANMALAALLLAVMLVVGPTFYICNAFTNTLGQYINRFFEMSLGSSPFLGYEWSKSWTLFYWAWWIAWSPFVGLFVARISRGRTIREFIVGALLVPTLLTCIWFSVFGASAIHISSVQGEMVASSDVSLLLFEVFSHYPFSVGLSVIAIVLLVVFFVTSADSATFVLGMMTSNGNLDPPVLKKVVWGITQSSLAAVLIFVGGLDALQKMTITAALPFCIIMSMLCISLLKALGEEHRMRTHRKGR
jgi:glycine betaine transporter